MSGFYDQREVDPEDLDDGFTVVSGDDTPYVFDDAEVWLAKQDVPDWAEYMDDCESEWQVAFDEYVNVEHEVLWGAA